MSTVELLRAGEQVQSPQAGDFFLVHNKGFIRSLIRFGQRLRFSKEEAYWNHAGVFVESDGTIIEALTKCVTKDNISKYKDVDYFVVRVRASIGDRHQMWKFAHWALNKEYGFLTDFNLALWCLVGGRFSFGADDTMICSGLVARTLERAGYIFERDPSHVMPADLAKIFRVHERVL